MGFTTTARTMSYEITDDARFLALLDSESYATGDAAFKPGKQTLGQRLEAETPARDIEYSGHFGAQIIFTIDEDDFSVETLQAISACIKRHLDWCLSLAVVEHVQKSRAR